jgi:hypothetical protein
MDLFRNTNFYFECCKSVDVSVVISTDWIYFSLAHSMLKFELPQIWDKFFFYSSRSGAEGICDDDAGSKNRIFEIFIFTQSLNLFIQNKSSFFLSQISLPAEHEHNSCVHDVKIM